jgi:hypothetical protein
VKLIDYRREAPLWLLLVLTYSYLVPILFGLVFIGVGVTGADELFGALPVLQDLPGAKRVLPVTVALMGVALVVLGPLAIHVCRRRAFCCCSIAVDALRFDLSDGSSWERTVAYRDIDRARVTRFGVLLEVNGDSWVSRLLEPLLIPTSSRAESERVVRTLEGLAPESPTSALDPDWCDFMLRRPLATKVRCGLLLLALFGLLLAPALAVLRGTGALNPVAREFAMLLVIPIGLALAVFQREWLAPLTTSFRVLQESLVIGHQRIPLHQVRVACTLDCVAAETKDKRWLLHLGDEGNQARRALEAALSHPPPFELPPWAQPPRVWARRRNAVLSLIGAGLAVGFGSLVLTRAFG